MSSKELSPTASSQDAAAVVLFVAIAALACLMPAQSDTWWLLRTGEEIWRTKTIVLVDLFTHTVHGQYWPNHEWLSQVIFYAAYVTGGLPLLTGVCAAAVVSAWVVVFRLTPGPMVERLLLVGCAAAFSTASWSLRPQVFTLVLFALVLWMLVRHRALWLLPLVFLVWANLHGGVAAGGTLLAAATLASLISDHRIDRALLWPGVLSLFATAVTPLGPSLWIEVPRSLERLKAYKVLEWRAPSLLNPADFPLWLAFAGIASLVISRRQALRTREPLVLGISCALTALLALRSARNASLFLVCAVPLAGALLYGGLPPTLRVRTDISLRRWSLLQRVTVAIGAVVAAGIVTRAWTMPLPRLQWAPVTERMRDALASCRGPLYNRYDEGGYLIWFVRERKVFIDSRQDPFPERLVLEQLDIEESGRFEETFARYKIECALTPTSSPLARRLSESGWRAYDAGRGFAVFARPHGS